MFFVESNFLLKSINTTCQPEYVRGLAEFVQVKFLAFNNNSPVEVIHYAYVCL